jgi:hypothetical protein
VESLLPQVSTTRSDILQSGDFDLHRGHRLRPKPVVFEKLRVHVVVSFEWKFGISTTSSKTEQET